MRYETNPEWKCVIRHNEDGSVSSIPMDEANGDYQEYLKVQRETEATQA